MRARLERVMGGLADQELDAVLVSSPENRRYLSGFTGSAGFLFIAEGRALLATDARYSEQAATESPDCEVQEVRRGWNWLLESLRESGVKRLGFESRHMTVATYNGLIDSLKSDGSLDQVSLLPATAVAEEQRSLKDAQELTLLQKAIDASDAAMGVVCPTITDGISEKEIAWRMETAMREFGADGTSFGTIVAAGPNGAMAHHRPSDQIVLAGEPIVIDMGARVGGYCSDITRTVVVGEPDETFKKVYDIVLGSQLTAISTVRAGMTGEEGDGLSRMVIEEAGYGENFSHSLGHGVGLAVHERPHLGQGSSDTLRSGMVFTVEPGIYISGWGGVRIEDIVVLSDDGANPLSKASK